MLEAAVPVFNEIKLLHRQLNDTGHPAMAPSAPCNRMEPAPMATATGATLITVTHPAASVAPALATAVGAALEPQRSPAPETRAMLEAAVPVFNEIKLLHRQLNDTGHPAMAPSAPCNRMEPAPMATATGATLITVTHPAASVAPALATAVGAALEPQRSPAPETRAMLEAAVPVFDEIKLLHRQLNDTGRPATAPEPAPEPGPEPEPEPLRGLLLLRGLLQSRDLLLLRGLLQSRGLLLLRGLLQSRGLLLLRGLLQSRGLLLLRGLLQSRGFLLLRSEPEPEPEPLLGLLLLRGLLQSRGLLLLPPRA